MIRTVIELDKKLREGEILIYRNGKLETIEIHELLPDLKDARERIEALEAETLDMKQSIAELAKIIKEK